MARTIASPPLCMGFSATDGENTAGTMAKAYIKCIVTSHELPRGWKPSLRQGIITWAGQCR